jgi:NitT/TauT family transport system permease protein
VALAPTAGLARLASLAGFFLAWQLVVWWVQPDLLPGPLTVFSRLVSQWRSGELPAHLFITMARVFGSFALAMILGLALGMLLGHSRRADLALDGLLTVFLNIPALVVIILCFIWFGLNEVAVILAVVLNKAPTMTVIFREGVRAIDRGLLEVGTVYGLSRTRRFMRIYLPQLYPYFLAATRSGLALVWKIVLVVELLGCSEGLGFQLGVFFQYFDITGILAYTFAFVILILLIEGVLLRPWERAVLRWRP